MGTRRKAREAALQVLYQIDTAAVPAGEVEQSITSFFELYADAEDGDAREFAEKLVRGCPAQPEAIDGKTREVTRHWRIERMARVDRNVMRLAVYELMAMDDVPRRVPLNEAVELAKRFGDENSASFVNGVLDRIASELGKD